jgi:hypothetical protein
MECLIVAQVTLGAEITRKLDPNPLVCGCPGEPCMLQRYQGYAKYNGIEDCSGPSAKSISHVLVRRITQPDNVYAIVEQRTEPGDPS